MESGFELRLLVFELLSQAPLGNGALKLSLGFKLCAVNFPGAALHEAEASPKHTYFSSQLKRDLDLDGHWTPCCGNAQVEVCKSSLPRLQAGEEPEFGEIVRTSAAILNS